MNQVKCPDCGETYSEDMQSCPNCGCPNDNWKSKQEDTPCSKKPTATNKNTIKSNTDWANYVYECGVLIWHTLTKKYINFSGRASRREFWSFTIFSTWFWIFEEIRVGATIWTLVLLLPWLSTWVRRMHDINKSGWWAIVPIASFFLALKKSDEGGNDYGEPSIDDI